MPSTQPSSECVDRSASRYGMRIENSSLVPSGVPSVKIENEASAPQARVEQRLGGGHLHRLGRDHDEAELVAGERDARERDDHAPQAEPQRRAHHLDVLPAREVPGRDRDDHARGHHERGEERVRQGGERDRVGEHREEVGHLGARAVLGHLVADAGSA